MKLNQISSLNRIGWYLHGITTTLLLVLFLSSCCVYEESEVSSKNCRCNQKELASLKNNKPGIVPEKAITNKPDKPENKIQTELPQAKNKIIAPDNMNPKKELVTLQTYKSKKLPLGIKGINTHIIAGPNMSNASIKETGLSKKSGAGFQFGVGSNYLFSKNFSINPKLLFRQNNFSTSTGEGSYETKTKYSYNYLSAPILARFRASDKLHLSVGPEINYLLSATSQTNSTDYGYGTNNNEKVKIKDQSVILGLGLEANISFDITKRLALQLKINKALSDISKKTESPDYGGGYNYSDSNNGNWTQLGLDLIFNLCRRIDEAKAEARDKRMHSH